MLDNTFQSRENVWVRVWLIRQEVSALRADFVRRQAEEEAYYAQQVNVMF